MNRKIRTLLSARFKYELALEKANEALAELCDFDASIEFPTGDGCVVLNSDTHDVAPISCLKGKSKLRKLSSEDHMDQSF